MQREQAQAVDGSADALEAARTAAGADGMVLVLGSLYLAGEVRTALGLP
jgi:folylpolyglutamate synthase/dihydropteroate synthase